MIKSCSCVQLLQKPNGKFIDYQSHDDEDSSKQPKLTKKYSLRKLKSFLDNNAHQQCQTNCEQENQNMKPNSLLLNRYLSSLTFFCIPEENEMSYLGQNSQAFTTSQKLKPNKQKIRNVQEQENRLSEQTITQNEKYAKTNVKVNLEKKFTSNTNQMQNLCKPIQKLTSSKPTQKLVSNEIENNYSSTSKFGSFNNELDNFYFKRVEKFLTTSQALQNRLKKPAIKVKQHPKIQRVLPHSQTFKNNHKLALSSRINRKNQNC